MARSRSKAHTEADLRSAIPAVTGEVLPPPGPSERDLSARYARNLIANNGDVAKALAATFDVSESEAHDRMIELHQRAMKSTRAASSVSELFERHDVGMETRIAALRTSLFSDDFKERLPAIKLLNEMDASTKTKRIGTTWELFITRARAKAAGKKAPDALEAADGG